MLHGWHLTSKPPTAASSVAADFADPACQIIALLRHWECASPLWMCQLLSAGITMLRYSGRAESLMGMRITSHLAAFHLREWLREHVTVASWDACVR